MRATWENIARLLQSDETVSDVELAYRLDCKRAFVARVRKDLGMDALPLPSTSNLTPEQRVMLMAVTVTGGHRRWIGRRSTHGVPLLDHFTTACRVAFRMAHGREPEGQVRVDCVMKHCVEGTHLTDRVIREDRKALSKAGGVR